jgi:NAD(P)-dependent dehydrogenase (short-subunit alcohol dehydrogenase family)
VDDFNGRLCFITGGASGIGLSMARAFASEGATLAIIDIDDDALDRAAAELSQVTRVEPFHLDVSDRVEYARVADEAEQRLGPVAVLCNNAFAGLEVPLTKMTYHSWDLDLLVTLGGQVNGIQTFLPRMVERGLPGHIVNTASQAGLVASHGGRKFMYNMSKFAIVGMSEALVQQLAPTSIGMTLLCPGYVATPAVNNQRKRIAGASLDADLRQELLDRLDRTVGRQGELGRNADEVGREVLAAIKADQFYLHTANRAAEVQARCEALIASFPPPTDHDRAWEEYVSR